MIPARRLALTVLLLPALSACNSIGGLLATTCTDEARPAISLTIEDAATGGGVSAKSVMVTVVDGKFGEELEVEGVHPQVPLFLAEERRGTYRVTVSADGYATWQATGIRVHEDECHVQTRAITAALIPES